RTDPPEPPPASPSVDSGLVALIRNSDLIKITESVQACRDPDDDRILELAVNGAAAYIVTGDSDLLVMNPFRGVAILTPAELLRNSQPQIYD
ncbi:MAG: putative toxin-antitoxin system toxin component, PIN family, partial [bacterium]|nr:putative toxin-antitoxin system toxin component, PIN family [bacterium]